jgi:EpsI family protein
MNSLAVRVYAVVGVVLVAYGISYLVQVATEPPEIEQPNWTIRELPLQLGAWHGEDFEMDPKLAVATGADVIVNRMYRDNSGHTVSLHTASFLNPAEGIYHNPLNCYAANGWLKTEEKFEEVKVADDLSIVVRLTTWEKENEKIRVLYWFQLGRHLLYERFDLGTIRWSMRGQPTWPILVKVMVQINMSEGTDTKTAVLGFARQLAQWLNQPAHRKYLDRWGGFDESNTAK